jgi:hypothetical protein
MNISSPDFIYLLCGFIYILSDWITTKHPPKKINNSYGYYYSISGGVFYRLPDSKQLTWNAITLVILLPLYAVAHTEKALKNPFND